MVRIDSLKKRCAHSVPEMRFGDVIPEAFPHRATRSELSTAKKIVLSGSNMVNIIALIQLISYFLLALSVALDSTEAGEDANSRGRVCISLIEPGSPPNELAFRTTSVVGPGARLKIYVDASTKCLVLVVALNKEGNLASGWRPQLSEVPEDFEEIDFPIKPVVWKWTAQGSSLGIYVLFMHLGSKDAEEAKRLASAMQPLELEDRLLVMQTNKLRELVGRIARDKQKSNQTIYKDPEVGGVFRGEEFPWRQFAQSVSFSDERPGVLIVANEDGEKTALGF
jgi:hypothetical protein